MADQPIRAERDQAYGARSEVEDLQRAQPLQDETIATGGVRRLDRLRPPADETPDFVFGRPSDNPEEPVTAGSLAGPGPGPESLDSFQPTSERDGILGYLASKRGNADAKAMLDQLRSPAPAPNQPLAPGGGGP